MAKVSTATKHRAHLMLARAKEDPEVFYNLFYIGGLSEYRAIKQRNPEAYEPTLKDAINEIANLYSNSYEEYLTVYEYLERFI